MTKAFGLVKPGDDVYLVCKDRETNLFKIRTVKVTEAAYLEAVNSIRINCGILEFTADANRTYAYHKHVNTFIKGFTNKEEAIDDYKARLIGEMKDLSVKSEMLGRRIYRAAVLLNNATMHGLFKESKK